MSHTILLQDSITIRGSTQNQAVVMPEHNYVDLAGFQDVAIHLEVSDFSNPTLQIQTSPIKEDAFFTNAQSYAITGAGIQAIVVVRWATAAPPPARWWRWRGVGSAAGAWSLTFRSYLNANQAGSR